jgi:hypothetical protein
MMNESGPGTSTLGVDEHHPAADDAMAYYRGWVRADPERYLTTKEAFASTALSGVRTAEICFGTMERLENGEPVSDRYVLGLCWTLIALEAERVRETPPEEGE